LRLFKEETLRADNFSSTESGCLLGKAGRARFYAAWEAASADLRTAINAEVDELVQRLGVATPPTDTTPGTDPAEEA
jgi:CRISPR-associated protein Cas1